MATKPKCEATDSKREARDHAHAVEIERVGMTVMRIFKEGD